MSDNPTYAETITILSVDELHTILDGLSENIRQHNARASLGIHKVLGMSVADRIAMMKRMKEIVKAEIATRDEL